MKTIATAALFLTLTASAWADEPESKQAIKSASSNEPIVLSEAEMDEVTAGDRRKAMLQDIAILSGGGNTSTYTYDTSGNFVSWKD